MAARFETQPLWLVVSTAVALVTMIGAIDFATGYQMSLFVFYALPILLVVWFGDRKWATFIALLSAIVWWWADWKSGHPYLNNWGQAWEAAVRLVFFLFVVVGGCAMKNQKDAIQERMQVLEKTRRLESEIVRVSEREQQRIGQDLHDGLCQHLAAIGCAAASLREELNDKTLPEAEIAAEIEELIKNAVVHARNLAHGIFPVQMDDAGLPAALEELAKNTSRFTNVAVSFECSEDFTLHDRNHAMHLYRIAQEAVNNALKHGRASKVVITLTGDEDVFELTISDNGVGFSDTRNSGMGMNTMSYRANLIGARLDVGNNSSGGAYVSCVVVPSLQTFEKT